MPMCRAQCEHGFEFQSICIHASITSIPSLHYWCRVHATMLLSSCIVLTHDSHMPIGICQAEQDFKHWSGLYIPTVYTSQPSSDIRPYRLLLTGTFFFYLESSSSMDQYTIQYFHTVLVQPFVETGIR